MKVLFPLLALVLLSGCQSGDNPVESAPAHSEAQTDPYLVTASDTLAQRLKVAETQTRPWSNKLKVSGSIELDEMRLSRVGSTVSGRVVEIRVLRGNHVKKGDVLAMVHSTALADAQLTYLKAHAAYQLAHKSVSRARALFREDVISAAELQRRESELLSSEAEWRAGRDRMQILGMSDADVGQLERSRQINSVTAIRAPIDGTVIERKVSQGQVLEPADLAYVIADLSHVWVVGEVPERYAAQMKQGKDVEVSIPALGNEAFRTKLIYVSETVNPQTRTLMVRTDLDNPQGRLKPEMLATLRIDSLPQNKVVVPESAVVRDNNQDMVFVELEAGKYRLIPVQLGEEEESFFPVEKGLVQGQRIVIDGVFHLNADRLLKLHGG